MNTPHPLRLPLGLLLATLLTLGACGQKGPLKVERPPVTQEAELEETK